MHVRRHEEEIDPRVERRRNRLRIPDDSHTKRAHLEPARAEREALRRLRERFGARRLAGGEGGARHAKGRILGEMRFDAREKHTIVHGSFMTSPKDPPAKSLDVRPSGFFAFRTPLLPFGALAAWSEGLTAPGALNGE